MHSLTALTLLHYLLTADHALLARLAREQGVPLEKRFALLHAVGGAAATPGIVSLRACVLSSMAAVQLGC